MDSQRPRPANTHAIATKCIEHLADEIDLLEQFVKLSHDIHQHVGLRQTDSDTTEPLLISTAERSQLLSGKRQQLRAEIGKAISLPISRATIRNLIPHLLPEQAQVVEKQRLRLLELEVHVQRQNNTNSLIISQTMDLYQKIACELSGTGSPATYSPLGELAQQNSPNLIQTDC